MVRMDGVEIPHKKNANLTIITADLLNKDSLKSLPDTIDIAYYLVHSMSDNQDDFQELEKLAAENFVSVLKDRHCQHVIYLSGLCHGENLSPHLASRLNVEKILIESTIPYTVLRAGIIVGAGSASFEIIRDLVEKLPVMIAPKWVYNVCQPIALHDIVYYLTTIPLKKDFLNDTFDVGGSEKLRFRDILLQLAEFRGLKRWIIPVPVLTPKLSSYWLYFVTATHFGLAKYLVESMTGSLLCRDDRLNQRLNYTPLSYKTAVERAFTMIQENAVISSWKDNWEVNIKNPDLNAYIKVPQYGCLKMKKFIYFQSNPCNVTQNLWSIGGKNGWYYMNWAWSIRGFIDKLFGGVGLRRGRRHPSELRAGDCLDFWRVITADLEHRHFTLCRDESTWRSMVGV